MNFRQLLQSRIKAAEKVQWEGNLKLSRRRIVGTIVGGAAAGPKTLFDAARAAVPQMPFPPPAPSQMAEMGGDSAGCEIAKEPSLSELRDRRARLEAQARGEGFDRECYPQARGGYHSDVEALKSVSPNARAFMINRENDRRQFENYCRAARDELEYLVKRWGMRLL